MNVSASAGRWLLPLARQLVAWSAVFLSATLSHAQVQTIPSGGVALVSGELATTGGFYSNDLNGGPIAERTIVSVTGQTFPQAARVATLRPASEF
ncbi:MAG TPA: hypothetical protein VL069_15785, partial [Opitutus sp.]|nr:hypothetical protein [Opitutus sp.]